MSELRLHNSSRVTQLWADQPPGFPNTSDLSILVSQSSLPFFGFTHKETPKGQNSDPMLIIVTRGAVRFYSELVLLRGILGIFSLQLLGLLKEVLRAISPPGLVFPACVSVALQDRSPRYQWLPHSAIHWGLIKHWPCPKCWTYEDQQGRINALEGHTV